MFFIEVDNRCELHSFQWYNHYLQFNLNIKYKTSCNYKYGVTKIVDNILIDSKYYKVKKVETIDIVFMDKQKISILNLLTRFF